MTIRTGLPVVFARVTPIRTAEAIKVAAARVRVEPSMPDPKSTAADISAISATTINTSTSVRPRELFFAALI
jgi:hypothetical protein